MNESKYILIFGIICILLLGSMFIGGMLVFAGTTFYKTYKMSELSDISNMNNFNGKIVSEVVTVKSRHVTFEYNYLNLFETENSIKNRLNTNPEFLNILLSHEGHTDEVKVHIFVRDNTKNTVLKEFGKISIVTLMNEYQNEDILISDFKTTKNDYLIVISDSKNVILTGFKAKESYDNMGIKKTILNSLINKNTFFRCLF
ncbi:hypothetical protein Mevan_0284 [Methanococcus vannielii SB]|uniref:Uncharacterized protein n=1 Tax=Methanococcus vannielii (strain ATCC 35089 / DSM 1224 / JCM 13029 / OCM 148 / SB) TaxID=406327 RepID=A6UNX1_METVS|nr:hypothetical protein [Methanococcus vannielii]ABR54193.1 hypothetical protein Mevan_0284 [Methanococcus vannielii SB]